MVYLLMVLSAKRFYRLPQMMNLCPVSPHADPLYLMNIRFLSADSASPIGNTRIKIPLNVFTTIEQAVAARDVMFHDQIN